MKGSVGKAWNEKRRCEKRRGEGREEERVWEDEKGNESRGRLEWVLEGEN